ncbi:MAG: DUF3307 domain-containing protein [Anaerolineae bacterium]
MISDPTLTHVVHILVPILVAHVLVDFVIQVNQDVESGRGVRELVFHSALVAILSYALVGVVRGWVVPAVIFPTHLLIDYAKARWGRDDLLSLALDHVAHLVVLLGLASLYPTWDPGAIDSLWAVGLGTPYYRALILVAGVIAAVPAGRVFVGAAVDPFLQQLSESGADGATSTTSRGFAEGGQVIGQLERTLILLFVLVDLPSAIGFLIAAKSVFRFGELSDRSNRMEAEYIIIGTMMSFAWGLSGAYLTQAALRMVGS